MLDEIFGPSDSAGDFDIDTDDVNTWLKVCDDSWLTLFIFYKNLVYKNIKFWNRLKIKKVILPVVISISFEGFRKKMMFL